jgi:hypothetical protein
MAIDIEMSGATLRDPTEMGEKGRLRGFPRPCEGDIIGIGARVLHWNVFAEQMLDEDEEASLFLPMYRPFHKHRPYDALVCKKDQVFASHALGDEKKTLLWKALDYRKDRHVSEPRYSINDPIYDYELANHTVFEDRCWSEFWSKHTRMLKQLEYKGMLSKRDMEKDAIITLFRFRAIWEQRANKEGCKFRVVADNVSFDIGMIDQLMRRYIPNERPSVYRAVLVEPGDEAPTPRYNGGTPCTHSMQNGLLAAVDPGWLLSDDKKDTTEYWDWLQAEGEVDDNGKPKVWSSTARIRYLYNIPKPEVDHDHNPANDAYTIAHEYGAIQLIAEGQYELVPGRVVGKRHCESSKEEDAESGESEAKKLKA